jgi:hypothetical protein
VAVYQRGVPGKLKPWYASVDIDSASFTLFAANPLGLRRKKIGTFHTCVEAEKQAAKMVREGDTRASHRVWCTG